MVGYKQCVANSNGQKGRRLKKNVMFNLTITPKTSKKPVALLSSPTYLEIMWVNERRNCSIQFSFCKNGHTNFLTKSICNSAYIAQVI